MTQYMATKTENLLEFKEDMYHWRGIDFPGLVDEETNALYDYPEDSFAEHVGIPTALEQGLIVPIEGEAVNWKDKLPRLPNLGNMIPDMIKCPAYSEERMLTV